MRALRNASNAVTTTSSSSKIRRSDVLASQLCASLDILGENFAQSRLTAASSPNRMASSQRSTELVASDMSCGSAGPDFSIIWINARPCGTCRNCFPLNVVEHNVDYCRISGKLKLFICVLFSSWLSEFVSLCKLAQVYFLYWVMEIGLGFFTPFLLLVLVFDLLRVACF